MPFVFNHHSLRWELLRREMLLYNLFLVYMRLKNSELLLINLQLVLNKMTKYYNSDLKLTFYMGHTRF